MLTPTFKLVAVTSSIRFPSSLTAQQEQATLDLFAERLAITFATVCQLDWAPAIAKTARRSATYCVIGRSRTFDEPGFVSRAATEASNLESEIEAGLLAIGLNGDASLPAVADAATADLNNCFSTHTPTTEPTKAPTVPTCGDKSASGLSDPVTSEDCGVGWHFNPKLSDR